MSRHLHPHFHRKFSPLATRFVYIVSTASHLTLSTRLSVIEDYLPSSAFSIASANLRHFKFTMKLLATLLVILPGLISAATIAATGTIEALITETCHNGDEKCSVLPLILLGRHSIKRCINHSWIDVTICNAEDICKADPSPQCTGKTVETRDEVDNIKSTDDESIDEDTIDAVSSS